MTDTTSYELKPGDRINLVQKIPVILKIGTACGAMISAQMKAGTTLEVACGNESMTITIDEWDGGPDLKLIG